MFKIKNWLILISFFLYQNLNFSQLIKSGDSLNNEVSNLSRQKSLLLAERYIDSSFKVAKKDILKAKDYSLAASHYALKSQSDTLILKASSVTSTLYAMLNNIDSSIYYGKISVIYAKKINDLKKQAMLETVLAKSYIDKGNYEMAHKCFIEAENTYKILNDTGIDKSYFFFKLTMSSFYNELEINDLAFKELFEAETIADSINDTTFLAQIYGAIAIFYKKNKNYKKAILYNKKALKVISPKDIDKAIIYTNLGNLYSDIEKLDSAIFFYKNAESIYLNRNADGTNLSYVKLAEANTFLLHERNKEADSILKLIDTTMLTARQKSKYYLNLLNLSNNLRDKLTISKKGIVFSQKVNDLEDQKEYHKNLHIIYEKIGEYKEAYFHIKEFQKLKDSIFNKEKSIAIQKVIVEKVISEKNHELKESELVHQNQLESKNKRIWFASSLAIALLGLLLFFIQRAKNNKQKIKLKNQENELLKAENKQVKSDIEQVSFEWEKSKFFLSQTKDELKKIRLSEEKDQKINSLFAITNQFIQSEEKKVDFQEKIKNIQDSFFLRLDELGKLSKTEKKLAALLRLQLTSKEIAPILNVSEKTVEIYRSRLRKKINILSEIDLNDYFKNL